jgi:hypothetical protein
LDDRPTRDRLAVASLLQYAEKLSKALLSTSIRTFARSGDRRTGHIEAAGKRIALRGGLALGVGAEVRESTSI